MTENKDKPSGAKKIIIWLIVFFVMFAIPYFATVGINKAVSIHGFSPQDSDPTGFEDYLGNRSWIFALLNLGRDIPYYKVEPNFDKIGPAATFSSEVAGKKIEWAVSYDSLTCLSRKLENTTEEQLRSIDWSGCKFSKNFGWGYATGNEKPQINITLGWLGFTVIFFVIYLSMNGFVLLSLNVGRGLSGILKQWLKI